jgi:hypothetical protein
MYDLTAREAMVRVARVLESQSRMPIGDYTRISGWAALADDADFVGDTPLAHYYGRKMELLLALHTRRLQ